MASSAAKPKFEDRKAAVFNSWKEIAAYLNRGVRTVQRWHAELHLPVHKIKPTFRSPVFAYKSEVDLWVRRNAQRDGESYPYGDKHLEVSSLEERATKSSGKMAMLIGKQHDQLNRLAEQINRLAQLQKRTASKVG